MYCRTAAFIFRCAISRPLLIIVLPFCCACARSYNSALLAPYHLPYVAFKLNCAFFPLHCHMYISTRSIICQNGIFYMRLCDPARLAACISARMVFPASPTAYSLMRSILCSADCIFAYAISLDPAYCIFAYALCVRLHLLHICLCNLPSTPPTAYSLMQSTLGSIDYISLYAITASMLLSSVLDLLITQPAFPNRLNSFFAVNTGGFREKSLFFAKIGVFPAKKQVRKAICALLRRSCAWYCGFRRNSKFDLSERGNALAISRFKFRLFSSVSHEVHQMFHVKPLTGR